MCDRPQCDKADNPPLIDVLAELSQLAAPEGYCFPTSRRSPSRSLSTRRRRLAFGTSFSTGVTASADPSEAATCLRHRCLLLSLC